MKLNCVDYLDITYHFSDEEVMAQHTARNFVQEVIMPNIEDNFEKGIFPSELPKKLGSLGFLGVNMPKEYGCSGMSDKAYGLVCQELERGDSGVRSFASVQSSLVIYPIYKYGTEEQRKKWIPTLASGNTIGAFGLTEPDHGSNPAGMLTRAVKVKGGYLLNGSKMWITNGSIADISIIWAKCSDDIIRGFIVEKDFSGFSAPEIKNKWSLRASVTSEIVLDNVFVPNKNLLPEVEGMKGPLGCLTHARFGIGWGAMGAAMAVYEASVQYATERKQFDVPIGSFQLIQDKLAWMLSEITKGQLLALEVSNKKAMGQMRYQQVSMLKRNNVFIARECAKLAREIHGANGISAEYPIMRHLMNLESVYTYEGTHEMHTLIIGEDITGIPAYK